MAHPRVEQLRFARSEWQRGLAGLSDEDAGRRLEPMNSISWMAGHLAWHERLLWLYRAQDLRVEPILDALASGKPGSTPALTEVQAAWGRVVAEADRFLDTLTTVDLERPLTHDTRGERPLAGTALQTITYHYWSHIGEASALRQMLGHPDLPEWVG
ncbi:MAG: DinB family protein, partial [Chloroflexi bacterium]|nr:DinB family protein [Chloroflexota bacterium]